MVVHCRAIKGAENFIFEFTGVTRMKISNEENMNENMQKLSPRWKFMHAASNELIKNCHGSGAAT